MDKEKRRRCIEAFQASMNSELGREVDKYLSELPEYDSEPWNFSSILKQVKEDPSLAPDVWLRSLKTRADKVCQMIGRETPVSLCVLTIVKEIEEAVLDIAEDRRRLLRTSMESLTKTIQNVIDDLPDSMSEFQEYMARPRHVVHYKTQQIGFFDESLVPIDEVEHLMKRCESVQDDETLAGVVEIVQRYEPDIDSSNYDDTLEVDMGRFNAITIAKIRKYLDSRHVPDVSFSQKSRTKNKQKGESLHKASDYDDEDA